MAKKREITVGQGFFTRVEVQRDKVGRHAFGFIVTDISVQLRGPRAAILQIVQLHLRPLNRGTDTNVRSDRA